jgi:hypothetical protein
VSVSYVTIDEVKLYAFQYQEDQDRDVFDLLIPRASAIFDTLCGVSPGYFLPRTGSDPATEQTFYGSGGIYLTLPPHVEAIEITMPTGYTLPTYVEMDGSLFLTDSSGVLVGTGGCADLTWPRGIAVKVKAKWGYEATPDDVKEAVAELVVAMWRSKDSAFLKQINLENHQTVNAALPPRTRMIIDSYRTGSAWGAAFV